MKKKKKPLAEQGDHPPQSFTTRDQRDFYLQIAVIVTLAIPIWAMVCGALIFAFLNPKSGGEIILKLSTPLAAAISGLALLLKFRPTLRG